MAKSYSAAVYVFGSFSIDQATDSGGGQGRVRRPFL